MTIDQSDTAILSDTYTAIDRCRMSIDDLNAQLDGATVPYLRSQLRVLISMRINRLKQLEKQVKMILTNV